MTDSFWVNLPMLITALFAGVVSLVTLALTIYMKVEATKGRAHIVTALQNNDAKTDMVAAAMGVDTTKPAGLNPDLTQPVKV
jgi:hypothetical protein